MSKRDWSAVVFGGGTGEETRASIFGGVPLGGDSSRSSKDDSLLAAGVIAERD